MNVQVMGYEKIMNILNEWYGEIRKRNIEKAQHLKSIVDKEIKTIEDASNVLASYYLLEFRHQYMIDSLSIGKDSFNKIESFNVLEDDSLTYYYYFFKAMHLTITGEYAQAKECYEKAEEKLEEIPDQLEHAEFYFKLSTFNCHKQQYVLALKQASKAKEIFSKYRGYELNIGYCNNVSGLVCIHLKEYELAEEYLISAMDVFQKQQEEQAVLYARHNLGFMYANQNLSELAIRYLSEVSEKIPNNYKAILIEACEHEKIGEKEIALKLFEKGLNISNELKIIEYQHHFKILKAINEEIPGLQLEVLILEGNEYFEKEKLYEYIHEYTEKLAVKFYHEDNDSKASKYFYLSSQARKKNEGKEV
ncbi:TPA: tetratricopeptide repeat protein [Bacillus cereus]|nr:tetratricopeptide repeat protein [Bacillus thuringiensis]HEF7293001.1 tetratricopeptide repeat protein [Bacillus cereus]